MKALKTPLRYPGGKSRACTKMDVYIPDLRDYKEYREPFLGGGSVAIHITKKYPHLDIWVNDLYEPLYNFWRVLQDDGYKLYKRLQELKSRYPDPGSAKGLFLEAKELVNDYSISPLYRACSFYVINKCSFSGLTESSSFSKQASDNNFSMRGIEKLQGYTQIIKDNGRSQILVTNNFLLMIRSVLLILILHTISKITFTARKGVCTTGSITMTLPLIVTDILGINLYLITRLNSSKIVLKITKQGSLI